MSLIDKFLKEEANINTDRICACGTFFRTTYEINHRYCNDCRQLRELTSMSKIPSYKEWFEKYLERNGSMNFFQFIESIGDIFKESHK